MPRAMGTQAMRMLGISTFISYEANVMPFLMRRPTQTPDGLKGWFGPRSSQSLGFRKQLSIVRLPKIPAWAPRDEIHLQCSP